MGEKYAVCNKSSTCVEQMYFIRNTFSFLILICFSLYLYICIHTYSIQNMAEEDMKKVNSDLAAIWSSFY